MRTVISPAAGMGSASLLTLHLLPPLLQNPPLADDEIHARLGERTPVPRSLELHPMTSLR